MKIITVNVPEGAIRGMAKIVDEFGIYPSRSELIRVAVREFLVRELERIPTYLRGEGIRHQAIDMRSVRYTRNHGGSDIPDAEEDELEVFPESPESPGEVEVETPEPEQLRTPFQFDPAEFHAIMGSKFVDYQRLVEFARKKKTPLTDTEAQGIIDVEIREHRIHRTAWPVGNRVVGRIPEEAIQ